jgi:hypothetical protein
MGATPFHRDREGHDACGPLVEIFDDADLAPVPGTAVGVRLDTDQSGDSTKTLITMCMHRSDLNRFLALSPGVRRAVQRGAGRTGPLAMREPRTDAEQGAVDEPDFPWWRVSDPNRTRRFSYSTSRYDFVEVIVDESCDRLLLRVID